MPVLQSPVRQVRIAGTRVAGWLAFSLLVIIAASIGAACGLLIVYSTDLPEVNQLERYRPSSITEIYDDQGREIGSFALQRRVVARYEDFPKLLRDSVLSTEDKDFENHWGINFWRILGAAYRDLRSGGKAQGASTLTMQLARNLFLSPEKAYIRKLQEIVLAMQIERRFTKPQIFTMYANQIYLGHGVYGFEAGAEYYFSKRAKDLTLDEAALLAGLPQAPNSYSPILHPERALRRRNIVINNLLEDGKITVEQATAAKSGPIRLNLQTAPNLLAPYYIEELRKYLEKRYGAEEVHEGALRVYTGIDSDIQIAANKAVLEGIADLERRHGWKGGLENVLASGIPLAQYQNSDWDAPVVPGSYVHALVLDYSPEKRQATVCFGKYIAKLGAEEMKWALASAAFALKTGDVVYVRVLALGAPTDLQRQNALGEDLITAKAVLEQDSGVQGAFLLIDNATGDVKALVGGRNFNDSKFDRATQAERQVGSSFKPYVYTTAIQQGMKPDDLIVDAPTTFMTASGPYTPHNYDNRFKGPIPLSEALAESRNIPALKVAEKVGISNVIATARRFGITSPLPPVLPLALGAADLTLVEQVSAFTAFPNDGIRIAPRWIKSVNDYDGRVLEHDVAEVSDATDAPTARTMVKLLQGVVQHGTSTKALVLKHAVAGKTGTTNDFTDAWFVGFTPSYTAGVWLGYDEKKTLGPKESGADAALPIWIDVMKVAIAGHPNERFPGDVATDSLKTANPATAARSVAPNSTTQSFAKPARAGR